MLNEIDLSRADLNLLVLFETVMREQNVARAAARLNLTASAVSHGLGRLRRLMNDPLFLRTPRGVVPTDRALELAAPIADILQRVRGVLATAEPFDPGTSRRSFTIDAPDAVAAVVLRALLDDLARRAPGIGVSLRQALPQARLSAVDRAWEATLAALDRRETDLAVIPIEAAPARFLIRTVYQEDFVAVCRDDQPFATGPTLDRFCAARHLIVSRTGALRGLIDEALDRLERQRRVVVAVPNFMLALALVAETDLVAAVPRHLAAGHAAGLGLAVRELPVPVEANRIQVVAPEAAILDAGIAWMFETLCRVIAPGTEASGLRPDAAPSPA